MGKKTPVKKVKATKPKSVKKKKVVAKRKRTVRVAAPKGKYSVTMTVNGVDHKTKADTIADAFQLFNIDPQIIKSKIWIVVKMGTKQTERALTAIQYRRIMNGKILRDIISKKMEFALSIQ